MDLLLQHMNQCFETLWPLTMILHVWINPKKLDWSSMIFKTSKNWNIECWEIRRILQENSQLRAALAAGEEEADRWIVFVYGELGGIPWQWNRLDLPPTQ